MALSWWDMPGPSRFVKRVENDLWDRVNVIASLPTGLGQEWLDFFRRRWMGVQNRVDVLRVSAEATSPIDELCTAFTTHPEGTITIATLSQEPGFCGRTVSVLLDNKNQVQPWMEFLSAYERECRMIDVLDRTVLLLVTDGISPRLLPSSETYLRIHSYEGYAQTHDCYMYAWVLLGTEEMQAWRTELKIALSAQLAQWDPRLCEMLSDCDIMLMLEPGSSVVALPNAGYSYGGDDEDDGWANGILQRREGHIVYHSGWIARDATSQEFQRRVWTAQVQVIFPLIEQIRQQAIKRYGSRFRLPVLVGDGEYVNDPNELEIAMVRRIISRLEGVPRTVLRRLDQAWEFRNALAHIEPLTSQQLQMFEPSLDD